MSVADWRRRFQAQLDLPDRDSAEIVFLGDSITEAWGDSESFNRTFGARHPLNLGISGDQTQHLLWRIEQGVLAGTHPSWAIVQIGVNNLNHGFTPEQTAGGVAEIVRRLREQLPETQVVILAILPTTEHASDPMRALVSETNSLLALQQIRGQVAFADLGPSMLDQKGAISPDNIADLLHPTEAGYALLSAGLERFLAAEAKRNTKSPSIKEGGAHPGAEK
ncbi:MAG TPA: GDSL-type esterase/lipase family protein [Polyangiaceae bacterium]|nr:GDSL-type esterase/lipase family protein [Polyangiaceae bacterium]